MTIFIAHHPHAIPARHAILCLSSTTVTTQIVSRPFGASSGSANKSKVPNAILKRG